MQYRLLDSLVVECWLRGSIKRNVIWDIKNPSKSEVIVRCGGDEKKTNDHAEPTISRTLKKVISSFDLSKTHLSVQIVAL